MPSLLLGASVFVLLTVALGLFAILRRSADVDRLMAVQLLGTGGVAILLLLAVATETPPVMDVAVMLALFAAFAAVAFVRDASAASSEAKGE
ncbi:monovalent cation/H+ antiporter complex subunit F [Tardiphaga sp. 42S5]|uniref:monovalent cation/H+ antiporter complex subunit F n=1 Tax=Tardiphaga sp. 42S5 TaxID=1404799 RepID=UPI002A5AEA4C|nr:monovalent cation/H+ antiporter complex subunit F [Tardiphaga sp. 42S5]WPO41933.1 monovalent cation/H+ antiporter complex subunit F [Tardiphaga sp. 42S5]